MSRRRLRSGASRATAALSARARQAIRSVGSGAGEASGSPADFEAWLARGVGRRDRSVPDAWRARDDLPFTAPARMAVVVHVYYTDLLEQIVERLAAIPVAFDLLVTNASGEQVSVDGSRLPRMSASCVLEVENRGRDILPLVRLVNAGLLDPYELILKVHTKRSDWRDAHETLTGTGVGWRDALLDALVGDEAGVSTILNAFAASPRLGLVTADGNVLGPEFWGGNEAVASTLLRRLELELDARRLVFAAGSMYWVRGFVLQGLRALNLSADDFELEANQVDATTAHAIERLVGVLTEEAGLRLAERSKLPVTAAEGPAWQRFSPDRLTRPHTRFIPFYLPQFHPIPQNDRWWGNGFTEWTNVTTARPVYRGHHQPKLPTDTGFYDLRLPAVVDLQTSLAEAAGIAAFMYYHYWFAGQELLAGPIQARLGGDLPLPFCLMWANENWTRRWDGRDADVLIGQRYNEVPAANFIQDVLPILRDPRYLRIDGRAVLAIYRPGQIPGLPDVVEAWRSVARQGGIGELCVLAVDVEKEFHGVQGELAATGLDGTLGFPPHNSRWAWMPRDRVLAEPMFAGSILSYKALAEDEIRRLQATVPEETFPGVMVAFDNTARRQRDPDIWYGSNPYTFRRWLAEAASSVAHRTPERRVVFINAWNEWAEGATLEPSDRFGSTYLLAVRDVARS